MASSSWCTRIKFCIAFLFILSRCEGVSTQVDQTLEEEATGPVVVRAVIEKISRSIFPLFNECEWWRNNPGNRVKFKVFLRNAAFVLTEDGVSRIHGLGIWNISNASIYGTKCNLSNYQKQIKKVNKALTYTILSMNLGIPMYSGLAASLCIHQYLTRASVAQCDGYPNQPDFGYVLWMSAIGITLSESQWRGSRESGVIGLEFREECSVQSDIVFVMDSSNSVTKTDFSKAKRFVCDVSEKLSKVTSNRIGVIVYARNASNPLQLTQLTDETKTGILMKIKNIQHVQGLTNTADGLCQLMNQTWRNNAAVLRLAIVLSDGMSNEDALTNPNCSGNVKEVANLIHSIYPRIIVATIGIGDVNHTELSYIASDDYLISTLKQYSNLGSITDELRYQICYTLPAGVTVHDLEGTIGENEIMRYVLENITQDGVSIRFCISSGAITFYVAQDVLASAAMHDKSSTITTTKKLPIMCNTIFEGNFATDEHRQKRQASQSSVIYLSIQGRGKVNTFTLQSGHGNVSFDIDECKSDPSPCDESATCHNTDGSFYCECNLGYNGDGFKCTSYIFQLLVFLVPSVFMGVLLLCVCVLLIAVGICTCRQKPTSQKTNKGQSDSKKSPDKKSLSLSTSF